MENNHYLDIIKQAYIERIKTIENQQELLINSKNETIENLKEQIKDLNKQIDFLKQMICDRDNIIQVYNQYNIKSPGGTMSNPIHSESGDNVTGDKVAGNQNKTYEFKGATFEGGFAQGNYTQNVTNNYADKELDATVNKINQLIEELSQHNPSNNTSDNMKIAVMVVERVEKNLTWKQKAIQAGKQGLLESMKSNPIGAFVAGAIEGWKSE